MIPQVKAERKVGPETSGSSPLVRILLAAKALNVKVGNGQAIVTSCGVARLFFFLRINNRISIVQVLTKKIGDPRSSGVDRPPGSDIRAQIRGTGLI